jgi:hypothetical protein
MNPKGDEPFTMFGTTFRGAKIVRSPASDNAKRHMTRSWTFTGAATLVALALVFWHRIALPGVAPALGMSAYGAWASYWGVVGVSGAMLDPNRKRAMESHSDSFLINLGCSAWSGFRFSWEFCTELSEVVLTSLSSIAGWLKTLDSLPDRALIFAALGLSLHISAARGDSNGHEIPERRLPVS